MTVATIIGASDNSNPLPLLVIVREVLLIWTEEIAIKTNKTALFKKLTSLMALLTAFSENP